MSLEKLDTEIRREQIVQAALQLVAAHGMRGLRIAEIARHVGLVPSAIYRHFSGKGAVLDAIMALIEERLMGNVAAACAQASEPIEQIRQLLVRHVQLIREYQALPRIIFSEEVIGANPANKARLHAILSRYLAAVADLVREGQQQQRIRPELDSASVAILFIGLFQPSAFLWHLSEGKFDVTRQAERAWAIFYEGIRTR